MNDEDARKLREQVEAIHEALLGTLDRPGGVMGALQSLREADTAQLAKLNALNESVRHLQTDVNDLKNARRADAAYSKGRQAGLVLGAGGIGAAFTKLLDHFTR